MTIMYFNTITKDQSAKLSNEELLKIVQKTSGALGGGKYYPDEFVRAKKIFIKEYGKKYGPSAWDENAVL